MTAIVAVDFDWSIESCDKAPRDLDYEQNTEKYGRSMKLTIAVSDLKGSRSRHLIVRYVSIEGQGHFSTLAQGCVHTKIQTGFSQKLLYRSEPNFV